MEIPAIEITLKLALALLGVWAVWRVDRRRRLLAAGATSPELLKVRRLQMALIAAFLSASVFGVLALAASSDDWPNQVRVILSAMFRLSVAATIICALSLGWHAAGVDP